MKEAEIRVSIKPDSSNTRTIAEILVKNISKTDIYLPKNNDGFESDFKEDSLMFLDKSYSWDIKGSDPLLFSGNMNPLIRLKPGEEWTFIKTKAVTVEKISRVVLTIDYVVAERICDAKAKKEFLQNVKNDRFQISNRYYGYCNEENFIWQEIQIK